MEDDAISIWSKKQDELTVSDTLKISAAGAAIGIAVPLVIVVAVGGVCTLVEKIQLRRKAKTEVVKTEV
jgi:hypothetical protein